MFFGSRPPKIWKWLQKGSKVGQSTPNLTSVIAHGVPRIHEDMGRFHSNAGAQGRFGSYLGPFWAFILGRIENPRGGAPRTVERSYLQNFGRFGRTARIKIRKREFQCIFGVFGPKHAGSVVFGLGPQLGSCRGGRVARFVRWNLRRPKPVGRVTGVQKFE